MISQQENGKDLEGNFNGLNGGTVTVFAWRAENTIRTLCHDKR
jgi:hypothetical protein